MADPNSESENLKQQTAAAAESFKTVNDANKAYYESLKKVYDRFGGLDKAMADLGKRIQGDITLSSYNARASKEDMESYRRVMRERKKTEEDIIEEVKNGYKTQAEANEAINANRESVLNLVRGNEQLFEMARREMDADRAATDIKIKQNAFLARFGKQIEITNKAVTGFGNALLDNIKNAATSSDPLRVATGVFSSEIAMAGSVAQGLGQGIGAAGAGLSGLASNLKGSANPAIARLGTAGALAGTALQFLGPMVGKAGSAFAEIASKVLPMLADVLSNTYTAFNAISSSGAVFANGVDGMKNAGKSLNLLLPDFAKVIADNRENLAQLGISTAAAARRMGEVGTVMQKTGVSMQLQRLGFTFQEQAGLIADTMSLMRQSGGPLTASNEEVAKATQKYAENLRIISAITGEDAKKKEQQVRDQANELAFQQKLAGMDTTQRQNVIAAMENMSDAQRKAFMETTVFGQAITPESAYAVNNIRGFGDSVNLAVKQFNEGTLDAASQRRTNAEFGETIKQDILAQKDLAMAGMAGVSDIAKGLSTALGNELKFRNTVTAEAIATAEEDIKKQKGIVDAQGNLLSAESLSIDAQGKLIDAQGKVVQSLIDANGKTVSAQGVTIDKQGQLLDANGAVIQKAADGSITTINEQNEKVKSFVNMLQTQGVHMDAQGQLVTANGEVIKQLFDAQGKLVDATKLKIDEQGKIVDDQGNTIVAAGENIKGITEQGKSFKEGLETATDTTQSMLKAVNAGIQLQLTIQDKLIKNDVLGVFARSVAAGTNALNDMIQKFTGTSPDKGSNQKNQETVDTATAVGENIGAVAGAALGTLGDEFLGPFGTMLGMEAGKYIGGAIGGFVGRSINANRNDTAGKTADQVQQDLATAQAGLGMADGGIANGSSKGYLALLHGREAVLPPELTTQLLESAKENRNVSMAETLERLLPPLTDAVKIVASGSSISNITPVQPTPDAQNNQDYLNSLPDVLRDFEENYQKSQLNKTNDSDRKNELQRIAPDNNEILLQSLNDKFDSMLSVMRDVNTNTNRTAARVA